MQSVSHLVIDYVECSRHQRLILIRPGCIAHPGSSKGVAAHVLAEALSTWLLLQL